MDEQTPILPEEPQPYLPRPAWQVWGARIALVILCIGIGLWLYHIAFPGV